MNKLYISILALAALSGAAYANDRGYDAARFRYLHWASTATM